MDSSRIEALVAQLRAGQLSRRQFMGRAAAMGLSVGAASALVRSAGAQGTTSAKSGAAKSPTRDEVFAQIKEKYKFEDIKKQGGQVIWGELSDISTLNTTLVDDVYSNWICGFIFDGIVGTNYADGTVAPGLADSWDIADDGVTYTFHLNPNAKFHDGQPVTADDVIFTYDGVLADKSQSVRKGSVQQFVKSYKKVDDHTVEFVAKQQSAIFLLSFNPFGILPKHIWQDVKPENWGADPGSTGQDPKRVVGSGSMKFVEWKQGDHVTLAKNADYWDKNWIPNIDTFTLTIRKEQSAAIQALLTGEIDVTEVPFSQAKPLEANEDLKIDAFDTFSFNWYSQMEDPKKLDLFADVKVRQAMMYGLDRKLMAEQIYLGFAEQANGTQPVLSIAYAPDQINTVYNFDPDKAKALLKEAGWEDTNGDGIVDKNGKKFSFECLYTEGVTTYQQQLPYMQQAWKAIGIEMIPASVPFPTLSDKTNSGDFQMVVWGFSWDTTADQGSMFGCDQAPPVGFNVMHYCDKKFDELQPQQIAELDQAKRVKLLVEQANIVNDDSAAGILVFRKSIYGNRTTLHNFVPNGYSEIWSLPFWWNEVS
jgi:peptide/nickel transport system substrate-binding protein